MDRAQLLHLFDQFVTLEYCINAVITQAKDRVQATTMLLRAAMEMPDATRSGRRTRVDATSDIGRLQVGGGEILVVERPNRSDTASLSDIGGRTAVDLIVRIGTSDADAAPGTPSTYIAAQFIAQSVMFRSACCRQEVRQWLAECPIG
jgi:hypothetical protein